MIELIALVGTILGCFILTFMIKQSFSDNILDFLKDCTVFYPFKISHILTANELVFTDKFLIKDKQISGNHKFDKLYSLGGMKHDSAKFLLFYHYPHLTLMKKLERLIRL